MKSPAFQFYPSDWLSSRTIRLMDAEQRGWYIQLLAEAWESETQATLPNDDQLLRVLAGVNSSSTDVERRWNSVKSQFKKRGSVIYNERQMEEVVKQEVNRQKKSEAGKASAEARKAEREAIKNQHLKENKRSNRRSTPVEICSPSVATQGVTESNSSIPISIPITTSPSEEKKEARAEKPHDARRNHPAVVAVRQVRGAYPPKDLWDVVIETVGAHPNVPLLKKCWHAWRTRGYAPTNYGWLVDWYPNGIQENGNGTNQQRNGYESAAEKRARGFNDNLAVIAELRRESVGDHHDVEGGPSVAGGRR